MLFVIFIAWQVQIFSQVVQAERLTYSGLIKFHEVKDYPSARRDLIKAVDQNPAQSFSLIYLGVIDFEEENFRSSINWLLTLEHLSPFFPQSNLYLGLSYFSLGNLDSAFYFLQREIKLSTHPRGYLVLSQLYRKLGDSSEEIKALKNIIRFHRPLVDSSTIPYHAYALERLDSLHASEDSNP